MTERCDSCDALIWWATSDKEPEPGERPKRNPIDHASADDPKGNLEVWYDGQGVLRYRYLKKGEVPAAGRHRGISHYSTCPQASQWRGRRRGQPASS